MTALLAPPVPPFDAASARIRIDIFNGTAACGVTPVRLSDGEFAVLTAIALHRRMKTREEWCDALWPDRDLESSLRLLKVYVHRIRTKFATHAVIESCGRGYRIGGAVRVDIDTLDVLIRDVSHGATPAPAQLVNLNPAFDGFAARGYLRASSLPEFDVLEARIVAAGIELGRMLAHRAIAAGDARRALEIAEFLTSLDAYDEVAAELLIVAHQACGRRDAAARAYHTFCRTLRDELDVKPSRHLADLIV